MRGAPEPRAPPARLGGRAPAGEMGPPPARLGVMEGARGGMEGPPGMALVPPSDVGTCWGSWGITPPASRGLMWPRGP